ncbi:MAG TPA: STAS domain-containing protein, partial [Candidatus Polarisedimenticolia bacterium]
MSGLSWLRRHRSYTTALRQLGDWTVLEVHGRFVAGMPEQKFLSEIEGLIRSGSRRLVVDMTGALLADDTVATAIQEVYHKARLAGVDMRFVVQPGAAGGYYHMAGLEMTI